MRRNSSHKRDGGTSARSSAVRQKLNVPLLLGTVAALVLLAPAAYAWHAFQVRRIASALLDRATELESGSEFGESATYLYRYLRLHPEDDDTRVRLAKVFDRAATDRRAQWRAVDLYYRALGVAAVEQQPALRRRLAELLLEQGRYPEAEAEASSLLLADAADAEAKRLLALALYGQFRTGALAAKQRSGMAVGEALEQALQANPDNIQLAILLATIYREEVTLLSDAQRRQTATATARFQRADALVDAMVAANPRSVTAVFSRYLYRVRFELPQADEDLRAALALGPDDVVVRLAAAQRARSEAERLPQARGSKDQGQALYRQAREHYQHVLKIAPAHAAAHLGLGEVYRAEGDVERAIDAWRSGLQEVGADDVPLHSRLAEVLIDNNRLDEAERSLEQLDAALAKRGAQLTRASRETLQRMNDLLRATWLAKKNRPAQAIPLLTRVVAGRSAAQAAADAIQLRALLLLGGEHAALGQWDQAAAVYEKAAALQPRTTAYHLAAARVWAAAGQFDKALACGERALAIEPAPATWLLLAQVHRQQQLRVPAADRNWEAFDKTLAQARKTADKLDQPWRVALLEADAVQARRTAPGEKEQRTKAVLKLLRAAEQQYPKAAEFQQSLVAVYEALGSPDDADRARASFDKLAPNAATRHAVQAALLARRKQFDRARELLRAGLASLPAAEHPALRQALVQVSLREGKLEDAYRELVQLHTLTPTGNASAGSAAEPSTPARSASEESAAQTSAVGVVRQLAELALDSGKFSDLERWEQTLAEREGPSGASWRYYKARRLLAQAKTPRDASFQEAVKLQAQLQTDRPSWPDTHLLAGLIEEAQGRLAEGAAAYGEAVRLGEQRITVFQRLIDVLYRLQRLAEAEQYLLRLDEVVPQWQPLSILAISVAVERDQPDRAEDVARRAVEQRPQDALAWMWHGQMLAMNKQPEKAESALRKATELAPDDARVWNALFSFYSRTGQKEPALNALQTLAGNARLSQEQRTFVLGQGYELLGDAKQAEENYREAARLAPQSVPIHMQLANFYLNRGNESAEAPLRHVLSLAPEHPVARRALATLLATRGGEEAWQEALQLLERTDDAEQVVSLNRRLQAVLCSQRPGAGNLAKARQILEDLVADPKQVTDGDRLLLAHLYARESESLKLTPVERQGKLRLAGQQYLTLAARSAPQLTHLAAYADFLLRQNQPAEAAPWIKRLDEVAAGDLRALAVRARWLQQQGRSSEIEPLVEGRADELLKSLTTAEQKSRLYQMVGSLYAAANQYLLAERWYRRLAESTPAAYAPLATVLAKLGRMPEAVRVCADAAKSNTSAQPAITLATLLASSQAKPQELRRAEPMLVAALRQHPDSADLLSALATLRLVQGQPDAAVQLYQGVLRLRPNDLLALNNLACLLAEQPSGRAEALQHISRAIELSGPQAMLYDTKGTILVYDGRAREAIEFLEAAAAVPEADPRFHFHLAAAYFRTQAVDKARGEFQKARDRHLTSQILTETDKRLLAELQQEFEK